MSKILDVSDLKAHLISAFESNFNFKIIYMKMKSVNMSLVGMLLVTGSLMAQEENQ